MTSRRPPSFFHDMVAAPIATAIGGAWIGFVTVAITLRLPGGHARPTATPVTPPSTTASAVATAPLASGPAAAAGSDAAPVAAADASATTAAPRRTYNVVLLTIDTLRADLGFSGYPRPVTPNLDALAARSAIFERAYATASYTPKSMGPMMIGKYATETRRSSGHYTVFMPSNVFVAQRAHDTGVLTFGGACHHYFQWKTGYSQGFDTWETSAVPPNPRDDDPRITSGNMSDVALRLLAAPRKDGAKFFAWFHYVDPHSPYVHHPGAPDFASMPAPGIPSSRLLYDEEVWYTDQQVGRVIDYIAAQPWAADTAVIVTADHGEAFGERGHWKHGRELWETLVHVPLLVHVPGAPPKRIDRKRSHIDLAPTILDLLGVEVEGEDALRGKSWRDELFAPPNAALEERDVFMDMPSGPFNEARRAIITGASPGVKLIHFGRRYDVFDLRTDPLEATPLPKDDERSADALAAFERMRSALREVPPVY